MAEQGSGGGGSSVNVVAIVAILVLAGIAAWFFIGRSTKTVATQTQSAPAATPDNNDVNVKIDLPDSVVIK